MSQKIANIDPEHVNHVYLGSNSSMLEDNIRENADTGLLHSQSKYKPYKDVECAKTPDSGILLEQADLSVYPTRYKIPLVEKRYIGNKGIDSTYYKYRAQRAGFYIVNFSALLTHATYDTCPNDALFTESIVIGATVLSSFAAIFLMKNNQIYNFPILETTPVRNDVVPDFQYLFAWQFSKQWALQLDAGDELHYELNLYDYESANPFQFYLFAESIINCYGTNDEDLNYAP